MKSTTNYPARLIADFQSNPDGMTVILRDGRELVVKRHEETEHGRRLKCVGFRGWVHASDVVSVKWFVVSLNPDYAPGGRFGPKLS